MIAKNIVILHGWMADRKKLSPLNTLLKRNNWNVLFPVLDGFQDKRLTKAFKLDDYAALVKDECTKAFKNQKYVVFGHSFGGRIAVKMAYRADKLGGMILCASGGFSRGNVFKRILFLIIAKAGRIFLINRKIAAMFKKLLYKSIREHDYERTRGALRNTFRNIIAEDLKPFVKYITVPTLILWGKSDKTTPYRDALFIKKNASNAMLVTYENSGHTLPYDKPNKIAEEIEKWYLSLN